MATASAAFEPEYRTMNRKHSHHRPSTNHRRALPGALVTLALGFAMMSSHAAGGEALDIELPSMRTPVEISAPTAPMATAQVDAARGSPAMAPLTRAEVRESLKMARLSNTKTPSGEIGDTPEVLQAREDFNALQTEVLRAEYAAAAEREQQAMMALRTSADQAVLMDRQEIVVAPEMTVGELISFLHDSRNEGTIYVMLPDEGEEEAD